MIPDALKSPLRMLAIALRVFLSNVRAVFPFGKKRILFLCQNALMAEYLADIHSLLKEKPLLEFYIFFCPPPIDSREEIHVDVLNKLPVRKVSRLAAYLLPWDMIVSADHFDASFARGRRQPVVRISHGSFSNVIKNAHENFFGPNSLRANRRPTYSRMLVSAFSVRDEAIKLNPAFRDVISVVGNLHDDSLIACSKDRDRLRKILGLREDDIAIYVAGSWGKWSLYQTIGDALLKQAEALDKRFRFILDVHPNEYRPRKDGGRIWGDYLQLQKPPRFIVRKPYESGIPYLASSDIFLCDYTSMVSRAVLLSKPVVFSPFPEELFAEGGPGYRLATFSPRLKSDASNIEECLNKALNQYPLEELLRMKSYVNSFPGRSAEMTEAILLKLLGTDTTSAKSGLR